ncbi:hypothetical protein BDY19DRAFT_910875, partial [Irpex rosettiformis]
SSLPRSPKKKAKIAHVSDSESSASDDDNLDLQESVNPEATPMTKITARLNDSVLNSAKKPKAKAVISKAEYNAQLKKFAVALGLDSLKDFFCEPLINTYAEVYRLPVQSISLCYGDQIYWFRLSTLFLGAGIQEKSKQEKDIVQLITTPKITSFIYNPARCDVQDFRLVTPPKETVGSRRPYLVHASSNQRVAFLIVGGVALSSLLDLQPMGQSGYSNRSLSICPVAVEYSLAWNFFSQLLKVDRISNYGGYANFSTFGIRDHNNRDVAGYKHQGYAPPPRTRNASASIVVHTVGVDYEKSLLQILKRGIDNGGLDSNSEVFNVSSKYGSLSSTVIPHSIETFVSLCAQGERYRGELPRDSLVAVLQTLTVSATRPPSSFKHYLQFETVSEYTRSCYLWMDTDVVTFIETATSLVRIDIQNALCTSVSSRSLTCIFKPIAELSGGADQQKYKMTKYIRKPLLDVKLLPDD